MGHTVEEIRVLIEELKAIHGNERAAKIESMLIVGVLQREKAELLFDMNYERFLAYIGLSKNQYWKRSQAALVCRNFPEALAMLKANEVEMSHLALLCPKITQANKDYILAGARGASTREVKLLLSTVSLDGQVVEREPEFDLHIKVTKAELEVLERVREVRSHSGRVPSFAEVIVADAEDALDRRDPLRKAERAKARASAAKSGERSQPGASTAAKREAAAKSGESSATGARDAAKQSADAKSGETSVTGARDAAKQSVDAKSGESSAPDARDAAKQSVDAKSGESSAPGDRAAVKQGVAAKSGARPRTAVPAAVRHAVWLRDQGKCTWKFADGSCCGAGAMVELDHQEMWCRGGVHSEENLALRCRSHNRLAAEGQLGTWFMARWTMGREAAR